MKSNEKITRKISKISNQSNVSENMNSLLKHVAISWFYFFSLLLKILKKVPYYIKNKTICLFYSLFNLFFMLMSKILRNKKSKTQFLL